MKKFNPTKFDHEKRCATIGRKGSKVVLQAIPENEQLSLISGSTVGKLLRKGQTIMAHLFLIEIENVQEYETIDASILDLLASYSNIFSELESLPPCRALNHNIPLKPGVSPISLRPYKYNYFQK